VKKKVLIHSNSCRAFTGFGKNKRNIMRYLHNTGKYELIELANGVEWSAPQLSLMPWRAVGSALPKATLLGMDKNRQREEGYGSSAVDRAVKEFKPDVYIGMEDIWAFKDYHVKPWWNKINCMVWTTLDSLPILPQAIEYAPKIKNYYVWASFAEKAINEMGYDHVKTLRGSLEHNNFLRLSDEKRRSLRESHGLSDEFIIGFVFRNQLRKSVPNLLEGFKKFKNKNQNCKAKLLLHTHWLEGWDIDKLISEKGLNKLDILTTYVCSKCGTYYISPYQGQKKDCRNCLSKGTVNTTNTRKGVSEKQLNEIYNLMDLYCHPFTSGGQEIPIQEAKLTELITLVTDYSCGEDNCTKESGGIPLDWSEYREPGTQFIKASTCADSIAKEIEKVYKMPLSQRSEMGKVARQWVIDNFSIQVIGKKLENIIDNMPAVNYDYDSKHRECNPDYEVELCEDKEELLINLYKNILDEDVDKNSAGVKYWLEKIRSGEKLEAVVGKFKGIAQKHIQNHNTPSLEDLLGKEDKGFRIAVVVPHSEVDVLLINSLMKRFKKLYSKYNIYFFTNPQYFDLIEDSPYVFKILKYTKDIENCLSLEGVGKSEGLFEAAFYPHTTTQKSVCFTHNGITKHEFSFV
jgi:glycosyltransferase involved in cell wall biosynthesis